MAYEIFWISVGAFVKSTGTRIDWINVVAICQIFTAQLAVGWCGINRSAKTRSGGGDNRGQSTRIGVTITGELAWIKWRTGGTRSGCGGD